ncbi:hypothetical protein [Bullifex sp.]|nr:hypothetical protein [Bullifex sp.]MDY4066136.1 hypothetical protein [Bullifex sp.]
MSIDNKLEIVADASLIFGPFKDLLSGKDIDFESMMTCAINIRALYNKRP